MQSPSNSPERGRGRAPSPGSPRTGGVNNEGQRVKNREEMRVTKEAVKYFKILCRDYGVNLEMNEIYRAAAGKKTQRNNRRRALSMNKEEDEELSSSSSLDEMMPVDGENEGLGNHARWADVQSLLNDLQTRKRIRAVKEISRALQDSADRAETELKELDELEQQGQQAGEGEEQGQPEMLESTAEFQADEELLTFKATDMKVVQALRRCVEFVPELKKRVEKKAELRKTMLSELNADDDSAEAETNENGATEDVEMEEVHQHSIIHEVSRKLRSFGDLKRDAPPDLAMVLEAQRAEIRAMAARIDEGERKVKTQRLALEYIDNTVDTIKVDPELLRSAISTTQDMRARILKQRREEEERRMRNERIERNMPSELEVQDCMDECEKLRTESERATERVERLLEFTASAASTSRQSAILNETAPLDGYGSESPGGDSPEANIQSSSESPVLGVSAASAPSAPSNGRRKAVRAAGLLQPVPQLEVSHEKAPEMHKQLKAEVAKLDGEIQEQQNRVANHEVTMRNAEQTLKVLEETKTLFLEQIAREKPSLLGDLGLIGSDDADEGDFNEMGSDMGSGKESEDELFESKDINETLKALEGEEQWLRMELALASSQFEEDTEVASTTLATERPSTPGEGEENAGEGQNKDEESTFVDVRKLAVRVEGLVKNMYSKNQKHASTDGEGGSSTEEDVDSHSADSEGSALDDADDANPRASATTTLVATCHADVQSLLELRHENSKMLQRIKEAQEELKDLREQGGAPGLDQEGGTEHTAVHAELERKQRELLALRKRWWSERQDPQTTVRRALAVAELPLQTDKETSDAELAEQPPRTETTSLFQRIYHSMTIA